MFSENLLEKHGAVTTHDKWTFTEMENFTPARNERAIGDQVTVEKNKRMQIG